MMVLLQISALLTVSVLLQATNDGFEEFYRYVEDNIEAAENYVYPTRNVEVLNVANDPVIDFGSYDFIIIGAGAAGSTLANRLSEIESWNILLLEAGGEQTLFTTIPGLSRNMVNSSMNWGYFSIPQTTACLGLPNNKCIAARGKVIGGTSTLNTKMYVRGNRNDYDEWASQGNIGWSYDEVLPYFIQMENSHIHNEDEGYHGHSGELDVSYVEPSPYTHIQIEAVKELGYEIVDYNGESQIGVSQVPFNIRALESLSGSTAFLSPIRRIRKNLRIELHSFSTKIVLNKSRRSASGVEFIKNGRRYVAKARKEVIVSAGTLNTPQILMLSGIGPRDELDRVGIDTYLDLPVGKNMADHYLFTGLVLKTNLTAYNDTLRTWLQEYLHGHRPLIANNFIDTCWFFNSLDESNTKPNVQMVGVVPPGLTSPPFGLKDSLLKAFNDNYDRFSDIYASVFLLRPKSKGTVTLQSADPADFPAIDFNFLSDPADEDLDILYRCVLKALALLDTKPYMAVNGTLAHIISGCDDYEEYSRGWWYCAFRSYSSSGYHMTGTARMGISTEDSVVNPELLVHGMRNLRVVDASVMPEVPRGNTAAPTFMVANKISDVIKKYYSNSRK